jgi:hypothetical protein
MAISLIRTASFRTLMRSTDSRAVALGLLALVATPVRAQRLPEPVQNADGLRMIVVAEHAQPTLRIVLPHRPDSDRTIEVIFPEHVTARRHGSAAEHLYQFRPGRQGDRPRWRRGDASLEYARDLANGVRFVARATLETDGVRFHYEFRNRTAVAYEMIYAVTDPRLTGMFHDVRLERTYVSRAGGVDLLASETPARLTMPLEQWLPSRYLASFRWPVPAERVERREDGITHYNASAPVDLPFIATLSIDRAWVVASFTREAGNVWSNPELTCQHLDPETSLAPRGEAVVEVKVLIHRGSLDDALQRAIRQRSLLK